MEASTSCNYTSHRTDHGIDPAWISLRLSKNTMLHRSRCIPVGRTCGKDKDFHSHPSQQYEKDVVLWDGENFPRDRLRPMVVLAPLVEEMIYNRSGIRLLFQMSRSIIDNMQWLWAISRDLTLHCALFVTLRHGWHEHEFCVDVDATSASAFSLQFWNYCSNRH